MGPESGDFWRQLAGHLQLQWRRRSVLPEQHPGRLRQRLPGQLQDLYRRPKSSWPQVVGGPGSVRPG